MLYIFKKEGEKSIEVHSPIEADNNWAIKTIDYEYEEVETYNFPSREQAEFFLEFYLHSLKEDGYDLEVSSMLTDLEK